MADLDAARARHAKDKRPSLPFCTGCGQPWPCDFALAIAALDDAQVTIRALVAPRDPFSVWQGLCGHLWRKPVDGEDCPRCAALALADELMELLSDFASNYHAASHYGLIDNCAVGACQDYCDALVKWEASRNHSETPKGSTDAKWEASR